MNCCATPIPPPPPFPCLQILKGRSTIDGRPGKSLSPLNLYELEGRLKAQFGPAITSRDVLSAALYPKVFEEYQARVIKYGEQLERLPTRTFLAPMSEDEEIEVKLARGSSLYVKYKAMGELQEGGTREVFFEVNGLPRQVEIDDVRSMSEAGARGVREKAAIGDVGQVGAPMSGEVVEVCVEAGSTVEAGQQVVVMSAMKMETAVCAAMGGMWGGG